MFELTPGGALTTLHNLGDSTLSTKWASDAGLIFGSDGQLYGTSSFGPDGSNDGGSYRGTVFKVSPSGAQFNLLYAFSNGNPEGDNSDGATSVASLALGSDGNFYGTAWYGGKDDSGTVFKITPCRHLTSLHSFNGTDGDSPRSNLILGNDGNFYGTTTYGGAGGVGTVFKITPAGV